MKPSNAWNPESNTILGCIHQVLLVEGLLTFDLEGTPIDGNNEDSFREYLSAVAYACFNRIQVMAPRLAPLFGVNFL